MSSSGAGNGGRPGLLVVTHGRLAEELVSAARTIVGEVEGLDAVSIGWHDGATESTRRLKDAAARLDCGQGVLLLTDMFGGTPTNLALALHDEGKIEVVTGVNQPMVVKFANLRQALSLQEMAAAIAEQGRHAIHVATHVLETPEPSPEDDS